MKLKLSHSAALGASFGGVLKTLARPRLGKLQTIGLALFAFALVGDVHAVGVAFTWAAVGNPGNPADAGNLTEPNIRGSVAYAYRISAHEVTNAQYAKFLNAVAKLDDPNGLYSPEMGQGGVYDGIARSGAAGSFTYTPATGFENKPVIFTSWYDAARFANWLHNGQPLGPQGPATTETGAYDMSAENPTRAPGAKYFLPSQDEWYKAAYYGGPGVSTGDGDAYWQYPTRSDVMPTAENPPGGANSANYFLPSGLRTDVGAYSLTTSAYGAFDMGGNVAEWTEAFIEGTRRGVFGGASGSNERFLRSSYRPELGNSPTDERFFIGFRIASLPTDLSDFNNTPIPGLPGPFSNSAAVAWGDYDNDNRLDFLIAGQSVTDSGLELVSQLWRNTGTGFVPVPVPGLPGLHFAHIEWGDYNNDGWLDFLISGTTSLDNELFDGRTTQLWRNTGGNGFALVPIDGLAGVVYGAAAWGDYDNDGRLDFMITGQTAGGVASNAAFALQLWRNTGNAFTNVPVPGVEGLMGGSLDWVDFNKDGLLDFSITGSNTGRRPTGGVSELWRNTGQGFVEVPIAQLPGVAPGSMAWTDYDGDGLLDFLLTGTAYIVIVDRPDPTPDVWGYAGIAQLWRNTGAGFTMIPTPGLPGIDGPVSWGDYDNDGRPDLLGSGNIYVSPTDGDRVATAIWRNTGSGFAEVPGNASDLSVGDAAWGDFDNDGRLDFLVTPLSSSSNLDPSRDLLWRNTLEVRNAPPSAPSGLGALLAPNSLTLSWLPASDDRTPPNSLSYNLVLSSTPPGENLASPMANLISGFRRVVQLGGANLRTSWTFTNLPSAPAYYWSVQAVDSSFAGGPFAPLSGVLPGVVVTSIVLPGPNQASVTFTGTTGQTYTVKRSDDLADWSVAGTATESPAGSGQFAFLDTGASANTRFYRIGLLDIPARFSFIPAGTFTMGNSVNDPQITDADPVSATVSAFYIGQTEVTGVEWHEVMSWARNHGYTGITSSPGIPSISEPQLGIDWFSALRWCNARSEMEGRPPVYFTDAAFTTVYRTSKPGFNDPEGPVFAKWDAKGYRLPTEAEWEKAARGGLVGQRFPWGNTISHTQANYSSDAQYAYDISATRGLHPEFGDASPYVAPVGHFQANAYQLYDVVGNLREWCWDWYATPYAGGTDPRGPATGSRRALRGGSWADHVELARRFSLDPNIKNFAEAQVWSQNAPFVGLRVVLPAGPP